MSLFCDIYPKCLLWCIFLLGSTCYSVSAKILTSVSVVKPDFSFCDAVRLGNYMSTSTSPSSLYENGSNLDFETRGIWTQRTDERSWRTKQANKKVKKSQGQNSVHLTPTFYAGFLTSKRELLSGRGVCVCVGGGLDSWDFWTYFWVRVKITISDRIAQILYQWGERKRLPNTCEWSFWSMLSGILDLLHQVHEALPGVDSFCNLSHSAPVPSYKTLGQKPRLIIPGIPLETAQGKLMVRKRPPRFYI